MGEAACAITNSTIAVTNGRSAQWTVRPLSVARGNWLGSHRIILHRLRYQRGEKTRKRIYYRGRYLF